VLAPLATAAAPRAEATRFVAAADTDGEQPWLLRASATGAWVERGGAVAARLELPPGARVSALAGGPDRWVAAATVPRSGGGDLALWQGGGDGGAPLPALPPRRGALRHDPQPILDGGRLVGLAWLEGQALDRLAVWSARWNGGAWREVGPASEVGPGSQLALSAAVLADGSWLLAWSADGGRTDEVVWSRRPGGPGRSWSKPAALPGGEDVPDITPALRADGDGALLVWSRFDRGDYRLMQSRFQRGSWSTPRWLGDPGTMHPSWEGQALLFRDARNGAWVGAKVAEGRLTPLLAESAPPEPRPLLLRADGEWRLLAADRERPRTP
jgi:hypothetical protein